MPETTEAYVVDANAIAALRAKLGSDDLSKVDFNELLLRREVPLKPMGPKDVRIQVLTGAHEGNIGHSATAKPVNIAHQRRNERDGVIIVGNNMIGNVAAIGDEVDNLRVGQPVMSHCIGELDEYGYPKSILGFDGKNLDGFFSREVVTKAWQVMPLRFDSRLTLRQLAALSLRGPTALSNWDLALKYFRAQVPEGQRPVLNVMGFPGGVSELILMLAVSLGHRAFYCARNPARRAAMAKYGIIPVDSTLFDFKTEEGLKVWAKHVKELTDGESMQLVFDYLRGDFFLAGVAALSRLGVDGSAGWQDGVEVVDYPAATMCVKRMGMANSHYATKAQCEQALTMYGPEFCLPVHDEVYSFGNLPDCFNDHRASKHTGVGIIQFVKDEEMPEVMKPLLALPQAA